MACQTRLGLLLRASACSLYTVVSLRILDGRAMPNRYYTRMYFAGVIVALFGFWACTEPVPATVYVPAPDYRQSLWVTADPDSSSLVRAGSWLVLHARRVAGPWQAVPRGSANLADCWWRRPPPVEEKEVAASVTWHALPFDSVQFNLPRPPAWERLVRFTHPGRYRLWATSHGCGAPLLSDTVAIEVVP
jgi:hypothetical protein